MTATKQVPLSTSSVSSFSSTPYLIFMSGSNLNGWTNFGLSISASEGAVKAPSFKAVVGAYGYINTKLTSFANKTMTFNVKLINGKINFTKELISFLPLMLQEETCLPILVLNAPNSRTDTSSWIADPNRNSNRTLGTNGLVWNSIKIHIKSNWKATWYCC